MKRCNKITVIWTCAIVVVALFWGVALYNNARKGQAIGSLMTWGCTMYLLVIMESGIPRGK